MKKMAAMLLALTLGIGVFVPAFAAQPVNAEKQEYLVTFNGEIDRGLIKAFGAEIEKEFTIVPTVLVELNEAQAKGLMNNPKIKVVELNAEVFALAQTVPWGVPHVRALEVHADGWRGNGVKVAVLDTGIDKTHEDLYTNIKGGYSVFTDAENIDPYNDGNGHGTHVAGTIAALDNTLGVVGVAPDADLYAVKVLDNSGSGTYAGIVEGLQWAVNNGMDIINMSLGASSGSSTLQDACNNAYYNVGVLIVAAAGNNGTSYGRGDTVGYPAKYSSVMAVAAVDSANKRPSFSSHGPATEIAAPGVAVLSTTPGNTYASRNGTSMACPYVSGVAALVKGLNPYLLSNVEVRNIINSTALYLGNPEWFGNGLVQAMNATKAATY